MSPIGAAWHEKVKIIVPDVPDHTRQAVEEYAREKEISRNQVALDALTERFGMNPIPPTGRYRDTDGWTDGPWSLEIPKGVRARLRVEAAKKGATISGLVRLILAERFGLPTEDPSRRPKGSRG